MLEIHEVDWDYDGISIDGDCINVDKIVDNLNAISERVIADFPELIKREDVRAELVRIRDAIVGVLGYT
jgi:hypothetical protein